MLSRNYKGIELGIIFFILPISFAFPFSIWIKLSIGFIGFIYILYMLLKVEHNTFKIAPNLNWKVFWKETIIKLLIISVLTSLFVWLTNKDALFNVLINKPKLWVFIVFIYSVFSVYPQELIYRTFFFQRYESLFKSKNQLLILNAIVFSLGHIFFRNTLVLVLTFLGGLLFAFTYNKTKSTLLVSIEHAIYGSWLFTVGMGAMLGFPS
ncbi:CPBP family intramembrane glutamic endopeptidase [Yeosuana marina]|uniref:CPBP family intramembrane glutamic endopeptidase n=1 Tax=Yeosuana marina TaxID=1565536 RepID=UPI0030EECF5A|tara:strand:- start:161 stop:787 length:627 start_codon:yes stop_codon:yes gene_type:complete